ncbi:helix-turn-helix transcriptional regulator [Actinomadura rubteroloni]|nr:LuxR family transcriptional regulator [Actinomadura rubteroloni]
MVTGGRAECNERNRSVVEGIRRGPRTRGVRRSESRLMSAALDGLGGSRAQVVELVGDPGMGKTWLLNETAREAAARGIRVMHDRYTESRRNALLRTLAMALCPEGAPDLVDSLPRGTRDRLIELMGSPWVWGDPGQHADRHMLYQTMRILLSACSSDGLVVLLDDAHWADGGSVEMVEQLVHRPLAAPLLMVVAQRPRQASARLRGALAHGVEIGTVRRVELAPLSAEQSAEVLGASAADAALRELHNESRGIPLYLRALAGERERGRVPEQQATLILDEIGHLDACEFRVISAAAVLGDESDLDTLTAVADIGLEGTRTALGGLTRRDLLRPVGDSSYFTFRHPLVRRLVYDRTERSWHAAAHRRAAGFLAGRGASATQLAVHVERCVSGPDPADLDVLCRAADDALMSDPETAIRLLRTALRFQGEGRARPATMLRLAEALGVAGRLRESRDLLDETLRLIPADDDHDVRVRTTAFYTLVVCLLGDYAKARSLLEGELTKLPADVPPRETTALIIAHGAIGAVDGVAPTCDQVKLARRLAALHEDRVAEVGALALGALCDAFQDDAEGAAHYAAAAAALTDRLSDADLAAHPEYLGILGWAEALIGRAEDARRHLRRGTTIARTRCHVHLLPVLLVGEAALRMNGGRPGEARRLAAEAREVAERVNADHVRGMALVLESLAAAWTGRAAEAVELGEEAERVLHERRFHWSAAAPVALAVAARLSGDPRRCMMLLLDAGGGGLHALPRGLRASALETLTAAALDIRRTGAAPVPAALTGEWAEQARDVADAADAACRPGPRGHALAALAHARRADGDPGGALELYREAVRLFAAAGATHAQALAVTAEAACLAALGRRAEAEGAVLLAAELARRSGAAAVQDQLRRLDLDGVPAGAPVPEDRLAVLTVREREIAERAGLGRKTREIAEELSLSPRTVDVHLTRIYRKLHITSRAALARMMAGVG